MSLVYGLKVIEKPEMLVTHTNCALLGGRQFQQYQDEKHKYEVEKPTMNRRWIRSMWKVWAVTLLMDWWFRDTRFFTLCVTVSVIVALVSWFRRWLYFSPEEPHDNFHLKERTWVSARDYVEFMDNPYSKHVYLLERTVEYYNNLIISLTNVQVYLNQTDRALVPEDGEDLHELGQEIIRLLEAYQNASKGVTWMDMEGEGTTAFETRILEAASKLYMEPTCYILASHKPGPNKLLFSQGY